MLYAYFVDKVWLVNPFWKLNFVVTDLSKAINERKIPDLFPTNTGKSEKKRMIKVGGNDKKYLKIVERVEGKIGNPKGHDFNFIQ